MSDFYSLTDSNGVIYFLSLSLSLSCSELDSGTLGENAIQDGTEIRLVPAVESGVTVRFL